MSKRQVVAQAMVALGSLNVIIAAVLHLSAGYPRVSAALASSNLDAMMANAMRSVFLIIGIAWIAIAFISLIAAFTRTRIRRALVLLCSLSLLAQIPMWVSLMGWFIGNEMITASGVLLLCGALLLPPSHRP